MFLFCINKLQSFAELSQRLNQTWTELAVISTRPATLLANHTPNTLDKSLLATVQPPTIKKICLPELNYVENTLGPQPNSQLGRSMDQLSISLSFVLFCFA